MSREPTPKDIELAEIAKKALADWKEAQKPASRVDALPVFGLRPPAGDVRRCECPMSEDTRRSVEKWPTTLGVVGCATCSGLLKGVATKEYIENSL